MDTHGVRTDSADSQKPPVKAGWTCLVIAWVLFLAPIPGLGMIGWALNFAAFIIFHYCDGERPRWRRCCTDGLLSCRFPDYLFCWSWDIGTFFVAPT